MQKKEDGLVIEQGATTGQPTPLGILYVSREIKEGPQNTGCTFTITLPTMLNLWEDMNHMGWNGINEHKLHHCTEHSHQWNQRFT